MHSDLVILPLAALLAASLGSAHAASERIEVQGQLLRAPDSTVAAELRGSYLLDDGRVLDVSARGRRLLVALDGGNAQAVFARSATQLQTADGSLQLSFRAAANGSVDQLRLTEPAAATRVSLR